MAFKEEYAARLAEAEKAKTESENAKVWLQFITKYRDQVSGCEANYQMAKNLVNDANMPFTVENLETLFKDPSFRRSLALTNAKDEREKLISDIDSLYTGGTQEARAAELRKLQYSDNDGLRARAQSLREKKELQQKNPQELRTIIKEGRPSVPEKPPLPDEYTRRHLLKLEPEHLRAIIRQFGLDAVNRRLAGQPNF